MELSSLSRFVWGPEMMVAFLLVGAYLSVRTGFIQITKLGVVFREVLGAIRERRHFAPRRITPFQATMIALGGTMGQGNLIGVTSAILVGGPGAIFWMWLAGFLGMAVKFAEATLAVHYRVRFSDDSVSGGPMYYLSRGLPKSLSWLGAVYALFAAVAAFGIGNLTQSAAMAGGLESAFGVPPGITGLFVAVAAGVILAGGATRIARVAEVLVPLMVLAFLAAGLVALFFHAAEVPAALAAIFEGAFGLKAALGGTAGYALAETLKAGVGRGIFSNEAGLGSAAIAHAQADVDHPVRQGFWGVAEVFLDTLVINTLMALIVLTSGAYQLAKGAPAAFVAAWTFPGGSTLAAAILALFVFTTLLSWGFYGEEAASYLFGEGVRWPYRIAYVVFALVGALGGFELFIAVADIMNGLMAIPNLIGLVLLAGVVSRLVREFFQGLPWRE